MHAPCTQFLVLFGIITLAACADRPDPALIGAPIRAGFVLWVVVLKVSSFMVETSIP